MINLDAILRIVDEHYSSRPHQRRPEQPDETLDIKGLAFHCTCEACPEQYDVFYQGVPVAYVRFRWGGLGVYCPHIGGENVLMVGLGDDGFRGMLEDNERGPVLDQCADKILQWMRGIDQWPVVKGVWIDELNQLSEDEFKRLYLNEPIDPDSARHDSDSRDSD